MAGRRSAWVSLSVWVGRGTLIGSGKLELGWVGSWWAGARLGLG